MHEHLENLKWTNDGVLDATVQISSTQVGRNGILAEVATYNHTDGFRVKDDRLYQNLFKDFANRTLKVVSWTVRHISLSIRACLSWSFFYHYLNLLKKLRIEPHDFTQKSWNFKFRACEMFLLSNIFWLEKSFVLIFRWIRFIDHLNFKKRNFKFVLAANNQRFGIC